MKRDGPQAEGCKPGLIEGATAYLLGNLDIGIGEHGDGGREAFVNGAYGEVSVGHAVKSWLETPEGAAFLPELPSAPGPYAQQIARLRETLH